MAFRNPDRYYYPCMTRIWKGAKNTHSSEKWTNILTLPLSLFLTHSNNEPVLVLGARAGRVRRSQTPARLLSTSLRHRGLTADCSSLNLAAFTTSAAYLWMACHRKQALPVFWSYSAPRTVGLGRRWKPSCSNDLSRFRMARTTDH